MCAMYRAERQPGRIEWEVEAGDIADAETLKNWLAAMIGQGSVCCDGVFLVHAHQAAAARDATATGGTSCAARGGVRVRAAPHWDAARRARSPRGWWRQARRRAVVLPEHVKVRDVHVQPHGLEL